MLLNKKQYQILIECTTGIQLYIEQEFEPFFETLIMDDNINTAISIAIHNKLVEVNLLKEKMEKGLSNPDDIAFDKYEWQLKSEITEVLSMRTSILPEGKIFSNELKEISAICKSVAENCDNLESLFTTPTP